MQALLESAATNWRVRPPMSRKHWISHKLFDSASKSNFFASMQRSREFGMGLPASKEAKIESLGKVNRLLLKERQLRKRSVQFYGGIFRPYIIMQTPTRKHRKAVPARTHIHYHAMREVKMSVPPRTSLSDCSAGIVRTRSLSAHFTRAPKRCLATFPHAKFRTPNASTQRMIVGGIWSCEFWGFIRHVGNDHIKFDLFAGCPFSA